jgi:hypothetical protein
MNEKCPSQSNQNYFLVTTWLGDLISVKAGDEVVGGVGEGGGGEHGIGEVQGKTIRRDRINNEVGRER